MFDQVSSGEKVKAKAGLKHSFHKESDKMAKYTLKNHSGQEPKAGLLTKWAF